MKFVLRRYQSNAIGLIRDCIIKLTDKIYRLFGRKPRVILVIPTGGGKTVCFSSMAEQAQIKGSRVSVVAHRGELLDQAEETMKTYGINPLMINYGMVQTYVRSPHKIPEMDLCIIDECHIGNFRRFVDLLPNHVQVIGVTATPLGSSKKMPLRETFDAVVCPVQISELIEKEYLSKPVYKIWELDETDLKKDSKGEFTEQSQMGVFSMDDLLSSYNQRVGKTIIFCSSIAQSLLALNTITEKHPDDKVFLVHSKIKKEERKAIIKEYKNTPNSTIINCGILTAGFDDPWIETVVLYRSTTSLTLFMQMVGRGGRVVKHPVTKELIKGIFHVHDLGNNVKRLLAWEVDRDWKLMFELQGMKLTESAAPMRMCVSCEAVIYTSTKICPYCNTEQPVKKKEEKKAGKVSVINDYSELPEPLKKDYSEMSLIELIQRAAYGSPQLGRPFNIGWILSQIKKKPNYHELLKELAELKGYKKGWVYRNM